MEKLSLAKAAIAATVVGHGTSTGILRARNHSGLRQLLRKFTMLYVPALNKPLFDEK